MLLLYLINHWMRFISNRTPWRVLLVHSLDNLIKNIYLHIYSKKKINKIKPLEMALRANSKQKHLLKNIYQNALKRWDSVVCELHLFLAHWVGNLLLAAVSRNRGSLFSIAKYITSFPGGRDIIVSHSVPSNMLLTFCQSQVLPSSHLVGSSKEMTLPWTSCAGLLGW